MIIQIKRQKNGKMSEADAQTVAEYLIKAGYMVSVRYVGKEKGGWIVLALDDGSAAPYGGVSVS